SGYDSLDELQLEDDDMPIAQQINQTLQSNPKPPPKKGQKESFDDFEDMDDDVPLVQHVTKAPQTKQQQQSQRLQQKNAKGPAKHEVLAPSQDLFSSDDDSSGVPSSWNTLDTTPAP